ncbi:MAG: L-ribulose-5-phosphate 4-epimerase [Saccharofermentanales bacterium]|nr:L-ribulose-5-phosphate 4-epimerase [Clostridiaceae bacterium]
MENLTVRTLRANLDLPAHRLVVFTWGNVSAVDREKGLIYIKPSGVPYDHLEPRHIVTCDLDGKVVGGTYRPSSDTLTHLELYHHFPNIGGIVHTHSRWATIWAQACLDLPALGTTHADYFYGDIPCTRHLTDEEINGNYEKETGRVIVETFRNRNLDPDAVSGVLVAGHGPFVWGAGPEDAVQNAVVLEECAMMAYHTRLLSPGRMSLDQDLLDRHYQRKHGKNAYYGQS